MLIETFPTMFFKWSRLMEVWFASLLFLGKICRVDSKNKFHLFYSFIQTGRPGRTNINDVVTHFNYIKALIGAEHACIGGDYNGVSSLPEGLGDVSTVRVLMNMLDFKASSFFGFFKLLIEIMTSKLLN